MRFGASLWAACEVAAAARLCEGLALLSASSVGFADLAGKAAPQREAIEAQSSRNCASRASGGAPAFGSGMRGCGTRRSHRGLMLPPCY